MFPADDRILASRPDVYPYRTVGQLLVKERNGGMSQGSASLLSDYTILTAGHMVKNDNNQFLDIEWIRFVPARNHLNEPYGRFDWARIRAVRSGGRDWTLISLAQPAGFQTGFLGANAQLPITNWKGVGGLSHIGFPGDHADEMWIDEDGSVTDIDEERQLRTNIDAAAGQSGGPLTQNWFGTNPQVIGSLIGGPNPVEDPNDFMPGWETSKEDTWMEWLCTDFGHSHPDDRFTGCSSLNLASDQTVVET
jgi:V8-like Glu-specific endopeptidase